MKDKKLQIIQLPNLYLWVMIVSWPTSSLFTGLISNVARAVFIMSAIIWSYEEIVHGASWVRKLLGSIVLAAIFVDLIRIISG